LEKQLVITAPLNECVKKAPIRGKVKVRPKIATVKVRGIAGTLVNGLICQKNFGYYYVVGAEITKI